MFDWDALVNKESEKILNYINKIIGNVDNSRDIVQDTFLACYQNIDRIDKEYILAWLYRTAHNKAINFVKKNSRLVYGEVPEIVHHDNTEEEIRLEKLREAVRIAFRKIKPKYAMLLDLQYYQKKSYKEIAEITNMSIPAIESLLEKKKKKIKELLKDYQTYTVL
jgi:RNA polymerase sigma-70 factor (ECF subfamily)